MSNPFCAQLWGDVVTLETCTGARIGGPLAHSDTLRQAIVAAALRARIEVA